MTTHLRKIASVIESVHKVESVESLSFLFIFRKPKCFAIVILGGLRDQSQTLRQRSFLEGGTRDEYWKESRRTSWLRLLSGWAATAIEITSCLA